LQQLFYHLVLSIKIIYLRLKLINLKNIFYTIVFSAIIIFAGVLNAQDKERVGNVQTFNQQGGLFNYGDKEKVNIEVSVWGYVKYPGKYIVPQGSTLVDLISYAGGPLIDAKLEEVRLFRPKNDTLNITEDEMIKINYNDIFWSEKITNHKNRNIRLVPGDILIFPGEPKLFFKDNITLVLSIASVLVSLAILAVSIVRKN
jgi:hypothetical protein